MVIIYTRKDLNSHGVNRPFDEVGLEHIRGSRNPFESASTVLFADGDRAKVLKHRYPLPLDQNIIFAAIPLGKHDNPHITPVL